MATAPNRTRTLVIAGQVLRFAVETRREEERLAAFAANEGRMLARVLEALPDGSCFYDVGANIGTVLLPVATAGRGPCLGFEPEPANAARLATNISLNGLSNATVLDTAVWSRPGTVALRIDGPVGTGTHTVVPEAGGQARAVPATTIDELVSSGRPPPHVIKIDVEGAGLEVLRGAAATLGDGTVRDLFVETHPRSPPVGGAGEGGLASFLERRGFEQVWEASRWPETQRHFRRPPRRGAA